MTQQLHLFHKTPRRRAPRKPPQALERRTHIAVADTLRRFVQPGWELWTHFPAGEHRNKVTGALLARMGMKRGWSDFVLVSPTGVHHWLELKRGKTPLSEAQEAFRDACRARGVPWAVARSYDEAVDVLTRWGALRLRVSA